MLTEASPVLGSFSLSLSGESLDGVKGKRCPMSLSLNEASPGPFPS